MLAATLLRLSLGRDLKSNYQEIEMKEEETNDDVVRVQENGNKSIRRVSIAQTVESKVFEPNEKVSENVTATAGESTSESKHTSLRPTVQKELTKEDIVSKKRAASAFVIHEVTTS